MSDIIADRRFLLTGLNSVVSKTFEMQILRPKSDVNGIDYVCELRLLELSVWERSSFQLHGVDAMQALELALEFKNKILEHLGETYSVELSED